MKTGDIAARLGLRTLSGKVGNDDGPDVRFGHSSDLLSDVLAHAPAGCVLVTIQVHMNVVAVAAHAGVSAVIFSSGMTPAPEVVRKAKEEGIVLLRSSEATFSVVGKLYALGIRGKEE
ncbi:MAG: serine kinase [Spirochaetes bacterium]|nr:serine kinase [Spirochaetota bacterium]